MMKVRIIDIFLSAVALVSLVFPATAVAQGGTESVRKERRLINEGNKLYEEKKYREAAEKFEAALGANANSAVATYNLGLTRIVLGSNPADTTAKAKELLEQGLSAMQNVAKMGQERPQLAAKAAYNLGNVAFGQENYGEAIASYKEALRLNPSDDNARRNLRIAQLKQQQNQDKNQDKQDQNKDQDKEQNQDKQDQNKDQNQNKDQKPPQQQQQEQNGINEQTADQILKAMENKENQTRGRVGNGQKAKGTRQRSTKNW